MTPGRDEHNSTLQTASSACCKIMPALPRLPRAQQEAGPARHAQSVWVHPGWQEDRNREPEPPRHSCPLTQLLTSRNHPKAVIKDSCRAKPMARLVRQ